MPIACGSVAWILNRFPVDQPRIDDAFAAIGRVAYLVGEYDKQCRSLERWLGLEVAWVGRAEGERWGDFMDAHFSGMKSLRDASERIVERLEIGPEDADAFVRARLARNDLTHEARPLPLRSVRVFAREVRGLAPIHDAKRLAPVLDWYREKVRAIVPAAALVSHWSWAVTAGSDELGPSEAFLASYPVALEQWVFAPVWDLLTRLPGDPNRLDDHAVKGRVSPA